VRAVLLQLAEAFVLLTRLPIGGFERPSPPPPPPTLSRKGRGSDEVLPLPLREGAGGEGPFAACVWAFPVAGAAVGAIGAAVYWLLRGTGMLPALAGLWALAAMVAATGGFHEDGLADTADGFCGGTTRTRKLEIMRDSRIGTFGALALFFSLAVRATAIIAISDRDHVAAALVVAGALGRGAIVGAAWLLSPACADGLGAALRRPPAASIATGVAISAVISLALLPALMAAAAILLAVAACAAMAALARAQIDGHTGDVLGAVEQLTECVVLTALATMWV